MDLGILSAGDGILSNLARDFLDVFIPVFCRSCGERLKGRRPVAYCPTCWGHILLIEEPICLCCGAPLLPSAFPQGGEKGCLECRDKTGRALDRVISAGLYDGVLKDAIHAFKLSGLETLAAPLAGLAVAAVRSAAQPLEAQGLVAVPPSRHRLRERGFDPTLELAREVAAKLDLPLLEGLLERTRGSVPQSRLRRRDRLVNPAGRFQVRGGEVLQGTRLLLVDDIMTTGATLEACAHALKAAGVLRVQALTVARGLQRR